MHRHWLLAILLVPLAMAHGGEGAERVLERGEFLNHIQPVTVELAPEQERNWTLAFGNAAGGGVLHEGWYWLLHATVEGDVRAHLAVDGQPLESWTWDTGAQTVFTRIPRDGFLNFTLTNVGSQNATVDFYYDQTCDCRGKVVPATSGPVWFNEEAEAGDRVHFNFTVQPMQMQVTAAPMPDEVQVRVRHLVPDDVGGFVPGERLERNWTVRIDASCGQGRWSACFDFSFTAKQSGMQLVWVDASHTGDAAWGTGIRPLSDVVGHGAPLGLWLVPLALAAVLRRR